MNLNKLETIFKSYPTYRLKQAYSAIFKQLIESWDEASNLPLELRTTLNQECSLKIKSTTLESSDKKTVKAKIILETGEAIETVLLRHSDGRNTVCVSSQIGCPLGCTFCATGKIGFKRNLNCWEIIEQILFFARYLQKEKQRLSNIVFMGMGEPLLNYDQVIKAIKFIKAEDKLNIGARRISVSTVGIIPGINKLAAEPLQLNLAISLHAPNNHLRSQLIPINKKYPLKELLIAVNNYLNKTKRRVMIEYLLLKDINDSVKEAKELAEILRNSLNGPFFVNLITYNPTDKYKVSNTEKVSAFKKILLNAGLKVTQRYRFGQEIKGACGQLVGNL